MPWWWDDFVDEHPWLATVLGAIRAYLPPLNFITIHYTYFIALSLVSSLIFWGSSNPALSVSYTDSLFLVVSALSEAGLNTVNLSQLTTWQQAILFLLTILGSSIWVSIWTVFFRKRVFEKRFDDVVKASRSKRLRRSRSIGSVSLGGSLFRRLTSTSRIAQAEPAQAEGQAQTETPAPPANAGRESPPAKENKAATDAAAADAGTGNENGAGVGASTASSGDSATAVADPEREGAGPDSIASQDAESPFVPLPRIVFADGPRPNTTGQATSSAYYQSESRAVHRGRPAADTDAEKARHSRFPTPGFLSSHSVGRNSQFHDLSSEEREHLGGCEYRALKLLGVIVPLYFFLWQFLGSIALGAWVNNNMAETATSNGVGAWWAGIFNGVSAFNNNGMSLIDANMIPFENADFVLITMGLMILAGNTAYPVFLRMIVWALLKLLRLLTDAEDFADTKATLEFILRYPRRVYTNLFPSRATWWLVFMLVLLNGVDWAAFELLNFGNPVIGALPPSARALDGLFQALAVRSGGFYVVPISSLYIGLQVLYVIMMYISVYPVVITMRHSNVYEERSLGIYTDDGEDPSNDPESVAASAARAPPLPELPPLSPTELRPGLPRRLSRSETALELGRAVQRTFVPWHGVGVPSPTRGDGAESRISFISHQIRGQLAHDLWWLVVAVLVITTIETSHFLADPVDYSVFNVIFEVVSAYGCVGISVGLPWAAYSFSGGWHGASKLVLCLVMLRGRHRGLPVALDRAVRLPGEQLHRDEDEDFRIRRSLTGRRMSLEV